MMKRLSVIIVLVSLFCTFNCDDEKTKKSVLKGKQPLDLTDVDVERLFDQWEENDPPEDPDDIDDYKKPPPKIDISKLDMSNEDNLLRVSKTGQTLMMFVDVREDLSEEEADNILRIWQGSLQNNHIVAERYPIEPKRAIFLLREGSQAPDAKHFFINQPELEHVTIEGQIHYGVNSKHKQKEAKKTTKKTEL